jgi:formylglycine-generating enzyme required for sulfatase activity
MPSWTLRVLLTQRRQTMLKIFSLKTVPRFIAAWTFLLILAPPNLFAECGVSPTECELRERLENLEKQVHTQQGEIKALRNETVDLKGQLGNLEKQVHTQQGEINALQRKINALQNETADLKRQLRPFGKQVHTQQVGINALQRKINALQNKTVDLKRQLEKKLTLKEIPGQVFRDRLRSGGYGPEMVVIPAGGFQMGDIQGSGDSYEKPVHWVNIRQFAMGKYEVTFAEYDKFAQATGRKKPDDKGWGRGRRPVILVSWNDAVAYTKWLSQQTGELYRLPSESEWEYAARGRTHTKFWWGNDIGKNRANCHNSYCGDNFKYTSPVGYFSANPFGLYDTVGNVWEWIFDSWHKDYTNAPNDGRIWAAGADNRFRVLRGGSWTYDPNCTRAAGRYRDDPDNRYDVIGFRLVRRVARTSS